MAEEYPLDPAAVMRYMEQQVKESGCIPMQFFLPSDLDWGPCAECGIKLSNQREAHLNKGASMGFCLYCRKCCPAGHDEAKPTSSQ
jgi:hypothetical protein